MKEVRCERSHGIQPDPRRSDTDRCPDVGQCDHRNHSRRHCLRPGQGRILSPQTDTAPPYELAVGDIVDDIVRADLPPETPDDRLTASHPYPPTTRKTQGNNPTPEVGHSPTPQHQSHGGQPNSPRHHQQIGAFRLNSERYGVDFKKIADEILTHLTATPGVELSIRVEIDAHAPDGFTENTIRWQCAAHVGRYGSPRWSHA